MKATTSSTGRHQRRRDAYRRQIGALGVFVEGTLCKVLRPGRKSPAWQLTYKQAGQTRTVYVPVALVAEVQQWASAFKRLKLLIRKVTSQNLAIIRRHGAVRRAANRARPRCRPRGGGNSSHSSATVSQN